jgi:hypothetical protein
MSQLYVVRLHGTWLITAPDGMKHTRICSDTLPNNFWRQVNANFLDMCVLEWCKLFADKREKHHWSKILTTPQEFETSLLQSLGVDGQAFQAQIRIMRTYRDKWVFTWIMIAVACTLHCRVRSKRFGSITHGSRAARFVLVTWRDSQMASN